MTGSSPPDGTVGISDDVVQVLLSSGLMKRFDIYFNSSYTSLFMTFVPHNVCILFISREEQEQSPVITPSGFQFLLMDAPSQIWYFMLKYLDMVEVKSF